MKPKHTEKQVMLYDASGRVLYAAIVCAFIQGVATMSQPIAVFAFDQHEARREVASRLNRKGVYHYTEIAIGPAIGFHAHDDNGDSCSFGAKNRTGHLARETNKAREGFSSLIH